MNHHDYFAEGVQSWFDNNRVNDRDHNHVNTRKLLIEYDPELAAICREGFGDTRFKYTKPATRLRGHMAGYDPTTAPTFRWPQRLVNWQIALIIVLMATCLRLMGRRLFWRFDRQFQQ